MTWKRLRDTATGATEGMQLLLQAAQKAAFPSGAIVNEFTQADLCARIQNAQEIWHAPTATAPPRMVVLPLSEIPDSMALVTGGGPSKRHLSKQEDERSCASSSWKTLSSNQSGFSHVSQDSLSGLGAVGDLEL